MPKDMKRQTFGRLRRFVRGDGVRMFFQPITDLDSGAIVGFESLARFDSAPSRPTSSWFDEAAAAGMRRELELTTARAALSSLGDIPEDAYLTVNASPDVAMDPAFIAAIPENAASRLVVEITEHAPIHDYDAFNGALETLRSRGVRVAIDDAGAGFANLTHILRIHPDLIKLDVELTRHVDIDSQRRALVRSLVEFARSVGATLVAEGIETEGELLALRSLGVAAGQGYHIGRPEPLPGSAAVMEDPQQATTVASMMRAVADAMPYLRSRRDARRAAGNRGRLRPVMAAVVGCLVLMPAGFAFADDAAPGDAGYWLKRKIESVRLLVALDGQSATRLHLEFARRRMDELSELLTEDRAELVRMVLVDYGKHIEAVDGVLVERQQTPPGLRGRIVRDLTDHVTTLDDDREKLCSTLRPGKACRAADDAIRRSKRALSRSERPAHPSPKPKNPKDANSQGNVQKPH